MYRLSISPSVGICTAAFAIGFCVLATTARADVDVYNNLTHSILPPQVFFNGGATDVDPVTHLVADNIDPLAGHAGEELSSFKFTMENNNLVAVTIIPTVQLYDTTGLNGGPGEFLGGIVFNPVTLPATTLQTEGSGDLVAEGVRLFLPVTNGGDFWAGVSFSTGDGATATAAQLNNIGQQVFNPPSIGSSTDLIYESNGTGSFPVDNPAGVIGNFGGSPVANFGLQFSTISPEANSGLLLGITLPALVGVVVLRRRKLADM
jgi:hypothetical protein